MPVLPPRFPLATRSCISLARCVAALLVAWWCALALPVHAAVVEVTQALTANGAGARFPTEEPATMVTLPDDWAQSRPRYDGSAWYRVRFDAEARADELVSVYVERVCTTFEVQLNGRLVYSGGRMNEPLTQNCYRPQLVTLPSALLQPRGNVLDLRVVGRSLQHVSARQRAAGLSALKIGPQSELADEFNSQRFWRVGAVEIVAITLVVMGGFVLGLGLLNPRETYLLYFGLLLIDWAVLSAQVWWPQWPVDTGTLEWLAVCLLPLITAMAVQFLLSYAGFRSRLVEKLFAAQCLLVPASLWLLGPARTFAVANAWYVLLAAELLGAVLMYLRATHRAGRADFVPMAAILGGVSLLAGAELMIQNDLLPMLRIQVLHFGVPLLFIVVGSRLLQTFGRALHDAEASRASLEGRVAEAAAEIERNYAQMSELRVEQVTEKERKRIAADLHDDLGAKLLTIVHTSESERISTLAREALEEMRLSVRGLTGRPVRLADALADWRAEVVSRLGQANIEADWRSPTEDITQLLPARAYVQTTRILREAVSNIIKHSGASHCKVRTRVGENDFGLMVQDNGKGIPMELDGRLDRGHGMSSMKHRAKQLQGQCLVESGPGYGTVIRVTLPL